MLLNILITIFGISIIGTARKPPTLPHIRKLLTVAGELSTQSDIIYTCDETNAPNWYIYCSGKLLEAVNILSIYEDSKTFVDMPMKLSPNETLQAFNERFGNIDASAIKKEALATFLNDYFTEPGTELEQCLPSDWVAYPPKLMKIIDPEMRRFALNLNAIWKKLCRKFKQSGADPRNSLIHLPNEFIVPGGRFREFYYWDAYWIIKGLLASGMVNTTKNMIVNMAHVVETYGFVPNGGRVYYLQRSQPPMLTGMVYAYFAETEDVDFLEYMLPILEKELAFWKNKRTLTVKGQNNESYEVFQYRTPVNTPRPESYREDLTTALKLPPEDRPQFYQDTASAAESGWDFSTRWFKDKINLASIETTNIVPIDLNSLMCWNMGILELFYIKLENVRKARYYNDLREEFRIALHYVFYNVSRGAWFDFNVETNAHNTDFYAAVAAPLFGDCYEPLNMPKPQRVFHFMTEAGAFDYAGGVPASLYKESKQQWDFPNGWGPLNHMIIEGLRKSDNPEMQEQAFRIAEKWIIGNYKVYNATGHMWEKYDVTGTVPLPGSGGEYAVQTGFGWTNGALLDLLTTYYSRIRPYPTEYERHERNIGCSRSVSLSLVFYLFVYSYLRFVMV